MPRRLQLSSLSRCRPSAPVDLEADNQVRANAYDRQLFSQRGLDWSGIAIGFSASVVANYSAGSLHGTLGGAFEGGPVDDRLTGDSGANALHGLAGDDWIEGGAGDDFLEGGAGVDLISGGAGNDLIFGNARAGLVDLLDPDDSVRPILSVPDRRQQRRCQRTGWRRWR